MPKTSNISAHVEPERKEQAEAILLDALSQQQLDAELEKGFEDIREGRVRPAEAFFREMERRYSP